MTTVRQIAEEIFALSATEVLDEAEAFVLAGDVMSWLLEHVSVAEHDRVLAALPAREREAVDRFEDADARWVHDEDGVELDEDGQHTPAFQAAIDTQEALSVFLRAPLEKPGDAPRES